MSRAREISKLLGSNNTLPLPVGSIPSTSSPETYGFNKDTATNTNLIVTTTNLGVDTISKATFATFDDVLFSTSGYSFSLSNGDLIATL